MDNAATTATNTTAEIRRADVAIEHITAAGGCFDGMMRQRRCGERTGLARSNGTDGTVLSNQL